MSTQLDRSRPERRTGPRVPADLAVEIHAGGVAVTARTVDASERGLLVIAEAAPMGPGAVVGLTLELPSGTRSKVFGTVVRREPVGPGDARVYLGVRFTEAPAPRGPAEPARVGKRRRKSRAKPKPPRPAAQVLAEMRAFSALVYEQALASPDGPPLESLLDWAAGLAGELGLEVAARPATNRAFLQDLATLHQRAAELHGASAGPVPSAAIPEGQPA